MKRVKVEFFNVYLKKGNKLVTIPFYGEITNPKAVEEITKDLAGKLADQGMTKKDIAQLKKDKPQDFKRMKSSLLSRLGCLYGYNNPKDIILTSHLTIDIEGKKDPELMEEAKELANKAYKKSYKWLMANAAKRGFKISKRYTDSYSKYCKDKLESILKYMKRMVKE